MPGTTFEVNGNTYTMNGADIDRDVVFFKDKAGKCYEMDYDTLMMKIMNSAQADKDPKTPPTRG